MRRALAAALAALVPVAAPACTVDQASLSKYPDSVVVDAATQGPVARAWYDDPVTRYRHFVLGRQSEPETLWIGAVGNHGLCGHALTLDADHVFEDTAPRLADLDGDGTNEVITVRSHLGQGAQIAIYRWDGADLVLDATTPYIGQAHRWLAPVAVADLDGDGAVEIAYVDRPHLARTLRVWRYKDGALTEVAAATGVTNHRIGESFISGGQRDCGAGQEMVLADAAWAQIVSVRFDGTALGAAPVGPFTGAGSMAEALACR